MLEVGRFTDRWIWIGAFTMLAVQAVVTYLPAAQTIFGTLTIGLDSWLRIVAAAVIVSVVVTIDRELRRRRVQRASNPTVTAAA